MCLCLLQTAELSRPGLLGFMYDAHSLIREMRPLLKVVLLQVAI